MTDVADLSPGTILIAGTTGWEYTVRGFVASGKYLVVRGPRGAFPVEIKEIQRGIADGSIQVKG